MRKPVLMKSEMNQYMVAYVRGHMCGPFDIIRLDGMYAIVSGSVKSGWFPKLYGNSKQRSQQRRELVRALNKDLV